MHGRPRHVIREGDRYRTIRTSKPVYVRRTLDSGDAFEVVERDTGVLKRVTRKALQSNYRKERR